MKPSLLNGNFTEVDMDKQPFRWHNLSEEELCKTIHSMKKAIEFERCQKEKALAEVGRLSEALKNQMEELLASKEKSLTYMENDIKNYQMGVRNITERYKNFLEDLND